MAGEEGLEDYGDFGSNVEADTGLTDRLRRVVGMVRLEGLAGVSRFLAAVSEPAKVLRIGVLAEVEGSAGVWQIGIW